MAGKAWWNPPPRFTAAARGARDVCTWWRAVTAATSNGPPRSCRPPSAGNPRPTRRPRQFELGQVGRPEPARAHLVEVLRRRAPAPVAPRWPPPVRRSRRARPCRASRNSRPAVFPHREHVGADVQEIAIRVDDLTRQRSCDSGGTVAGTSAGPRLRPFGRAAGAGMSARASASSTVLTKWTVMSRRRSSLMSSLMFFSFWRGRITSRRPTRRAASTFSLMPPTGSTCPVSVISPVMARSPRTGRPVSSDASAVTIVTPAEGPSLGWRPTARARGSRRA